MLLRQPDQSHVAHCRALTAALLDVFNLPFPAGNRWYEIWHPTRLMEWPWALTWLEKEAKILDVGSDPTFMIYLLMSGAQDITVHHTSYDTDHLCQLLLRGYEKQSLNAVWRTNERKLKMVLGYPDQLDIPSDTYDLIFNLSVMEHIPPENLDAWMTHIWRVLKPGGKLVMTCDWLLDDVPGVDITNFGYQEFIDRWGAKILTKLEDIPWRPEWVAGTWEAPDVYKTRHPANPEGFFSVYGFVLEKPKTEKAENLTGPFSDAN